MKKVLITGASGFIGRQCLLPLLEKGYEVHALALESVTDYEKEVAWHCQNFLDEEKTKKLLEAIRPSHCLHLAWYTEPGKYWSSPENLRWTAASISLIHSFYTLGGERFVGAGSCAEYDWRYGHCSEATTPLEPATLYGACKNVLQKVLAVFSASQFLSSAWGRVFFLYGPYEHPSRLIPTVIRSLLLNQSVDLSHGRQLRDYLHVSDAANAFVSLLDSTLTGSLNIASGIPVTIKNLVLTVANQLGNQELLKFGNLPSHPDEPELLTADITRIKNDLHFLAQYGMEEGLQQTIAWWKTTLLK